MAKKKVLMDFKAQHKLQRYIYEHGYKEYHKGLYYCNSVGYGCTGIGLSSNGESVRLTGAQTCKNLWSCPVCAAIGLAKHAHKITTIIKKFREHDIVAVMLTLTIPHFHNQSPKLVLDTHKSIQNKLFSNLFKLNKLGKSITKYGIISSYECNYSNNGYHFHSHNLIFIHKDDLQKLKELLPTWQSVWSNLIRRYAADPGKLNYTGCYLSVNADGSIRTTETGSYVTAELTYTQTKPTHTSKSRNIWELLYSGDDADMEIFLKYASAIKFRQKISYSHKIGAFLGLNNADFERLGDDVDILKCYRPVCVFSLQSWSDLRESDLKFGTKHRLHIMKLALLFDYWGIVEYCEEIGVSPPRLPTENELLKHVARVYKRVAA